MHFETKNGTVILDQCDQSTSIESDYTCATINKKLKKDFKKNFILGYRNQNLAKQIAESNSDKLFVIYGARHFKGLVEELQQLNADWKVKK